MRPFLKWAGNKHAILARILGVLPEGKRLIEPFAGSGAVFLNTDYPKSLLADCNADLIDLYCTLKAEGMALIAGCRLLFTPEMNREDVYYELRAEFNQTRDKRLKAMLFLYLNRHGYNGLCRYNAKGGFNVPFGRYARPYFPEEEMLAFHRKAQTADFRISDFREVMRSAVPGDVVYCDPPYAPLSPTANFTGYHVGGFGAAEQTALADLAEALAARGVPVIISNHDTEFSLKVYRNAAICRFDVRRTISCKGAERGMAKELLAFFKAA